MTDLVDQMFPPIHQMFTPEFTDFNYWRTPVQDFPLPDLSPPSPALSARSDTPNQTTLARIRNFSLGRQSGKQYSASSTAPVNTSGVSRRGNPLREMTSLEQLSVRLTRSFDAFEESSSSTLVDSEDERRARKRASMDSMPGSLPGSLGTPAHEDFEEEAEEDRLDDEEQDQYEDEVEDPEEAAEEGFDEDFLATGEMESIPFL